jgi:hypothetical protein
VLYHLGRKRRRQGFSGLFFFFLTSRLKKNPHQTLGEQTETAKFLVEQLLAMCKGTGSLEQRIMQVGVRFPFG